MKTSTALIIIFVCTCLLSYCSATLGTQGFKGLDQYLEQEK